MNTRAILIGVAGVLGLLVLAAGAWLVLQPRTGGRVGALGAGQATTATNPALDLRYSYDSAILTPAPYDARAEYPLRLDGQGFSFYGKRIRGAGKMLTKDPGGILYDFVGSTHLESFVQYYKLEPVGEALYEDVQLGGKLGLHQAQQYNATAESQWPYYFPAEFTADPIPATCYVEGWAVFTSEDLFFFQTVSTAPLNENQRQACQQVMDGLQFNAVLGTSTADGAARDSAGAEPPAASAPAPPPGPEANTGAGK
jgi:hypothetical protein